MNDRPGIEALAFLALIGIFALFGASARAMYRWEATARSWSRALGGIMISIFTAWLVGLALWDALQERPMVLMAVSGAAAWTGVDLVDRLARGLLGRWGTELEPKVSPPPVRRHRRKGVAR